MKQIALLLISFFYVPSAAQSALDTVWTISRNSGLEDEAWAVCVDDSNFLYWATFQRENSIKEQFVIYKLNEAGQQIWESKHYGITWWNRAFNIKERGDYVYSVGTGAINGVLNGPIDAVIICYNKTNGDTAWIRNYNQGFGYEEIDGLELADDAIYISGWTKSQGGTAQQDVLLLKMDYSGNFIDTAVWGSPGFDEANGEMVLDDSTIYIAGRWNATGPASLFDGDGLIASFNRNDLSFKDSAIYNGGSFMDDALGLGTDGTYLFAVGYTTNFGNSQQLSIWKYDKQLNLVWDTAWGGAGNEFARGIIQAPDGTMFISGNISSSPSAPTDIFLMKMETNGDILWYKTLTTDSSDLSHNLIEHNGSIYITGNSKSTASGNFDAWLIKTSHLTAISQYVGSSDYSWEASPNPFHNELIFIGLSAEQGNKTPIEVFDITGRKIFYDVPLSARYQLQTTNFLPGVYFIRYGSTTQKFTRY